MRVHLKKFPEGTVSIVFMRMRWTQVQGHNALKIFDSLKAWKTKQSQKVTLCIKGVHTYIQ